MTSEREYVSNAVCALGDRIADTRQAPNYYLSAEASEQRLAKLADKIAADPDSVPVTVQRKVIRDLAKLLRDRKEVA